MSKLLSIGKLLTNSMLVAVRNSYKSSISLEKLYPKSSLDILAKPDIKLNNNDEEFSGFIPMDKIQITKMNSSKPGGQHIFSKAQSSVEIRFHLDSSDWIPEWIRKKLKEKHVNRLNKEGFFILKSEKTRKALLNQADCFENLRAMIREVSIKPKELSKDDIVKKEINKKIADGRRIFEKRKASENRSNRRNPIYDAPTDYYDKY